MDFKARVNVNCEWKDGRATDGRKNGRLRNNLLAGATINLAAIFSRSAILRSDIRLHLTK